MGNLRGEPISLDEYFAGSDPHSSELFEVLRTAVESLGPVEVRATKSQIAFRRRLGFAWTWIPGQYLTGHKDLAPLVLTVDLHRHDDSPRWKSVVEPHPAASHTISSCAPLTRSTTRCSAGCARRGRRQARSRSGGPRRTDPGSSSQAWHEGHT